MRTPFVDYTERSSDRPSRRAPLPRRSSSVPPPETSQALRKLQAEGLLQRATNPGDSRTRRLRLNAAGSRPVARALADVETSDERYFAVLGDDLHAFARALATLGPLDGISQP
jgi:DNA-binding MarR family transcriptional regulator